MIESWKIFKKRTLMAIGVLAIGSGTGMYTYPSLLKDIAGLYGDSNLYKSNDAALSFNERSTAKEANGASAKIHWPDQGWSSKDMKNWYTLSQGSRLIPYEWFSAMTNVKTGKAFADRETMNSFGYPYWDEEVKLPIGFVIDRDEHDQAWLGLTCAACHTTKLTKADQDILIHGGQSLGNFRAFLTSLSASVENLLDDDNALDALSQKSGDKDALMEDIREWLAHRNEVDRILDNTADWGPGRLDAIAYIQTAVSKAVQIKPADYVHPANAPVNPPHVWNTNQQARLQHNGLVANGPDLGFFATTRLGAYIRNYGEAFGVFGQVNVADDTSITTSIKAESLLQLERSLMSLHSPEWPEDILGEIDQQLADKGEHVYQENCASCHSILSSSDTTTELPVKTPLLKKDQPFITIQPVIDHTLTATAQNAYLPQTPSLIGTDPMMVCNFLMHTSPSGKFEGKQKENTVESAKYFKEYQPIESTTELLAGIVLRDMKTKISTGELPKAYIKGELEAFWDVYNGGYAADDEDEDKGNLYAYLEEETELNTLDQARATCASFAQAMYNIDPAKYPYPGYKARPLNGIWASPPYLHNGSVPSMRDLLAPHSKRPVSFAFHGTEYDSTNMGLEYGAPTTDQNYAFHVYDEKGQAILGNWNGGHEYGTQLSEDDKTALIEYLKKL